MPVNLDALLRFHTIDRCLQRRQRTWRLQDLVEACSDALEKNVSKRTVQNDIKRMRGADLGYFAPIVCKNGYYTYEDPDYSIKNATLTSENIQSIAVASKVLGEYKGFKLHNELREIANKLETKADRKQFATIERVVEFEQADEIKGKEFLEPILQAIWNEVVLSVEYQRFDSSESRSHYVHPYLLKEYKSRWYLLGWNDKHQVITTYALDRTVSVQEQTDRTYVVNHSFDPKVYFEHTIGITYTGEAPLKVKLFVDKTFVPYLLSQPLHHSQELLEETNQGAIFQLEVVNNPEFRALILGYANVMYVSEPDEIREELKVILAAAEKRHHTT